MTNESNKRDYEQDWLEFINHQHMVFTGFNSVIRDAIHLAIEDNGYLLEQAIDEIKDKKLRDNIMQKHMNLDKSIEALDALSILGFSRNTWINEEKRKDNHKEKYRAAYKE